MLLAEAYFHTLDPFAIQFPDSWSSKAFIPEGIRWYGLSYAMGFLIAWWLMRVMARTGRSLVPAESVGDLMFAVIVGVLVGGRVGYAVFYDWDILFGFSSSFPYWNLLAINTGGMASHGGMLGMIAACWIFAARNSLSRLHLFDLGAFVAAPGLGLGRLANFVNAELWGRRLPESMQADPPAWSVKYPEQIGSIAPDRLPELAPAVEAIGRSGSDWVRMVERMQAGGGLDLEATTAVRATLQRLTESAQRGNEAVIEVVRPMLDAYWPSQIFQAITDGPILMGAIALVWLKPRKPGVIGCWFLMVYGVLRIATEVFREPDEGVALWLGLSRGQALSLFMVAFGAVALPIVARRDVERVGGLLSKVDS